MRKWNSYFSFFFRLSLCPRSTHPRMFPSPSSHVPKSQVPSHAYQCPCSSFKHSWFLSLQVLTGGDATCREMKNEKQNSNPFFNVMRNFASSKQNFVFMMQNFIQLARNFIMPRNFVLIHHLACEISPTLEQCTEISPAFLSETKLLNVIVKIRQNSLISANFAFISFAQYYNCSPEENHWPAVTYIKSWPVSENISRTT